MKSQSFIDMLNGAIVGNNEDIEKILIMYDPLITNASYLNGKLDEDLKQYLLIHIIKNLSKFKI